VAPSGVPTVVIGETVLVGDVDIPAKLEGLILQRLKK
jgi:protein-disulfide isomerase